MWWRKLGATQEGRYACCASAAEVEGDPQCLCANAGFMPPASSRVQPQQQQQTIQMMSGRATTAAQKVAKVYINLVSFCLQGLARCICGIPVLPTCGLHLKPAYLSDDL